MALSKLNKTSSNVDWGVETKDWEYRKCKDLEEDKVYPLKGCFITPDQGYGVGGVLISDNFLLNVPARFVDDIRTILADEELISEIKSGKDSFKVSSFDSKYGKKGYRVTFID